MFDVGPSELLLILIVAVIAIGPKELPAALRTFGKWIGQMRRVSAHFRTGLDAMIREAEMDELTKKWEAQNAKIMREHPADAPPEMEPTGAYPSPPPPPEPAAAEARVVTTDNPDEYRDMPVSGDKPEA
jgi:sec-independent protein translocase protein TatB